ncbi:hypothetical protein MIND_00529500 [Mycena indigotica]|uniref:Uncharacterized protein n=1 Tax=Mycena indigotica TaxID=2126181 RepID=A0A8H6SW72_9AGAR|nr:uncharacterized protein MIND_00529500 [Mycena indigotica]KAF7307355.1 hypothetical protein MIND_00529500 [Mycena indigotica]
MANVERLKSEGNELIGNAKYAEAYQKYSDAIAAKPQKKSTLSILYANRSTCSFCLANYLDAVNDANQATVIDPTYIKGYLRLAAAAFELGHLNRALTTWKKGLSCLENAKSRSTVSSDIYKIQKLAFDTGLAKTEEALRKKPSLDTSIHIGASLMGDVPTVRALKLFRGNQLKKSPIPSSAFLLLRASEFFEATLIRLQSVTTRPEPGVQGFLAQIRQCAHSRLQVIAGIASSILCDARALVMGPDLTFFQQLQVQMQFEEQHFKSFGAAQVENVKAEVQRRLKNSTWDVVYQAIAASVRNWIVAAFLDVKTGKELSAVEQTKCAVQVLEWGAEQSNTSDFEIFKPTFIRSVRRLHLFNAMSAYMQGRGYYSLEGIKAMARDLKEETETSIPQPSDLKEVNPGSFAAFHVYPIAEAYAAIAWAHRCVAQHATGEKASKEFLISSRFYIKAADAYPEDEEERPFLLYTAAENMWKAKSPLRVTLPVCRRIRESLADSDVIWGGSGARLGVTADRAARCQRAITFMQDCEQKIAAGVLTLDDLKIPAFI